MNALIFFFIVVRNCEKLNDIGIFPVDWERAIFIRTRYSEGSMLLNLVAIEKDDWHSKMSKFIHETIFFVQCLHLRTPDVDWEVESLYVAAFTSAYAQKIIKSLFADRPKKLLSLWKFSFLKPCLKQPDVFERSTDYSWLTFRQGVSFKSFFAAFEHVAWKFSASFVHFFAA